MNKIEKINLMSQIIESIREHFLRVGEVMAQQDESLTIIQALYAKQSNLIESMILLIENNMAEEATVLFRSAINNFMLIVYLAEDDVKKSRLREYQAQPLKSKLSFLHSVKYSLKEGWWSNEESKKFTDIELKISEHERVLKALGVGYKKNQLSPIKIIDMAKMSRELYHTYVTFYVKGSKIEHSDYSVLGLYTEISKEGYSIVTSRTNIRLDEVILNMGSALFIRSFCYLVDYYQKVYPHLVTDEFKNRNAPILAMIELIQPHIIGTINIGDDGISFV